MLLRVLLLGIVLGIGGTRVALVLVLVQRMVIIGLARGWARGLHALGDLVDPV